MNNRLSMQAMHRWLIPLLFIVVSLFSDRPVIAQTSSSSSTVRAEASTLRQVWRPVLGSEGPQMVDRVIAHYTPACLEAVTETELIQRTSELRASIVEQLGLDLGRRVLSSQVQRTFDADEYRIEVVRIEVYPQVYMPANVYIPKQIDARPVGLVLAIPGCNWGAHTAEMQLLAANLARLGMVVVVAEGFCDNGARAAISANPQVDYAAGQIGLPGSMFEMFLQELISTITWALETYPQIDPNRVGVAGYSYGGQMAAYLGAIDTRVRSVAAPATYIGDRCDNFVLGEDIWVESIWSDFVWGAPLRLPILPISWRIALIYPRALYTAAGAADELANPGVLDPVMAYADRLYRLGDYQDRLWYQVDSLWHGYQQSRREETYSWLMHTLMDEALSPHPEASVALFTRSELAVDIAGTATMTDLLNQALDEQIQHRFRSDQTVLATNFQVAETIQGLFPLPAQAATTQTLVWQIGVEDVYVRAYRMDLPPYALPLFVFENTTRSDRTHTLFLTEKGTYSDLEAILELLGHYNVVVSIDYLGVGELKSNRLLQHTFARYFMYNDPSAPKLNVQSVQAYLQAAPNGPMDIFASGWTSSIYALLLRWLEPEKVGAVTVQGVPNNALLALKNGNRVPDLLFWGNLFTLLTGRELATTLPLQASLTINNNAVATTSADVRIKMRIVAAGVTPRSVEVSNDGQEWRGFGFADLQQGVDWSLDPVGENAVVYTRLIDTFDEISLVISDTIHIVQNPPAEMGVLVNGGAQYVNSEAIALTIIAPAYTADMAIRDAARGQLIAPAAEGMWQWEPYTHQRSWTLADYGPNQPHRVVYVQFRDVAGNVSPTYSYEVSLDSEPPTASIQIERRLEQRHTPTLTLLLAADDRVSGVVEMQITTEPEWLNAEWQPYAPRLAYALADATQPTIIYARFRDRAGNVSPVASVLVDPKSDEQLFLPLVLQ